MNNINTKYHFKSGLSRQRKFALSEGEQRKAYYMQHWKGNSSGDDRGIHLSNSNFFCMREPISTKISQKLPLWVGQKGCSYGFKILNRSPTVTRRHLKIAHF